MKGWKKILSVAICAMMATSLVACSFGGNSNGGGSNGGSNGLTYSGGNWEQRVDMQGETVTLSKAEVRDKVLGMWVGSAIGLGSGFEYVESDDNVGGGQVIPGYHSVVNIADSYWEKHGVCSGTLGNNGSGVGPGADARVMQGKVISDDDMHVDILNQYIFRDYGPDLSAYDITEGWVKYGVSDVGGGADIATKAGSTKYVSPYLGQGMYGNNGWMVTESWIENESNGIIFPYMANTADTYCELFAGVQGEGYASFMGKFFSVMQSLAWEYSDVKVLLEKTWERFDRNNVLYEVYQYVLQEYGKGTPWRDVSYYIATNYIHQGVPTYQVGMDKVSFSMTTNCGMIFLGLIYGDGDYEKSIKITSLAGLDGDCTTCTVGQLMGSIVGYNALPQKYRNFLSGSSLYVNYTSSNSADTGVYWGGAFAYFGKNFPNIVTFNDIVDVTCDNIAAQVIARGGSVNDLEYKIVSQKHEVVPQVTLQNNSFENDKTGWDFVGGENDMFSVSAAATNFGEKGASLMVDVESEATLSQNVTLTVGNRYRLTAWMSGCTDREVRIFAGDKYRSVVNPANSWSRIEVYFTATTESTPIGVKVMKSDPEEVFSDVLSVDDFSIEDVTHMTEGYYQQYTLKDFYCSPDLNKTREGRIILESGAGLRFDYTGMKAGSQLVKIYYKNASTDIGIVATKVDGKSVGNIPLPGNGADSDYNEANCVTYLVNAGEGTHTYKLTLSTFEDLIIDRIEIYGGNPTFIK